MTTLTAQFWTPRKILGKLGLNYEILMVINRALSGAWIVAKYSTPRRLFNLIRVLYAYYTNEKDVKGLPFLIKVEATNVCDLGCALCPRDEIDYGYGKMDMGKFREIIDCVAPTAYFVFFHLWGESTFHKRLGEMVKYAKEHRLATYLSVNFNHGTTDMIHQLVDSGLDYLSVSVDGLTQETYEKFRVKGQLDNVVANIRETIRYRNEQKKAFPKVTLQFIAFKHNEHELEDVRRFAKELGVDKLDVKGAYLEARDTSEDERNEFVPEDSTLQRKVYSRGTKKRSKCFWLYGTTTITWNGLIKPCCVRVFNDSYGSFSSETFKQVWQKGKVDQLRCNIRDDVNITEDNCKDCDYLEGQSFLT